MIKHDVIPEESEYLLTEEDPVASTTPDSAEAEAATEAVLSVEDIAANLVEEEPRLVLEQDKEVTLRITRLTAGNEISQLSENYRPAISEYCEFSRNYVDTSTRFPDTVVVFREASPILGLGCEAASEVDSDIRYMWTRNGRFIDTTSSHATFETHNNGE